MKRASIRASSTILFPETPTISSAVRYSDENGWEYNNGSGFFSFDPVATDILVAAVDYANDTVASLEGQDTAVSRVRAGYVSGNLTFFANRYNGRDNNGEFVVFGAYITVDCEGGVCDTETEMDTEVDTDTTPAGDFGIQLALNTQDGYAGAESIEMTVTIVDGAGNVRDDFAGLIDVGVIGEDWSIILLCRIGSGAANRLR